MPVHVRSLRPFGLASATLLAACAPPPPAGPTTKASAVDEMQAEARNMESLSVSPLARRFLAATSRLPHIAPRTLYADGAKSRYWTERETVALEPAVRERLALHAVPVDEESYYETKYGSPVSYVRPLDVLAGYGITLRSGDRVLDFGYGYIGHLRLLASLGLSVTGVDVDPMLRALYGGAGDQGTVPGEGVAGSLRVLDGFFPKDPLTVALVGTGYTLVLSKNVLKRGYIHPGRPADPRQLIDLGLPDAAVVRAFFDALAPGGAMLVYNICPAPGPADKPFVPWSDGRSPFTREAWTTGGFSVVAFDVDDTDAVRRMGRALGWDKDPDEPMDLEHDLSVLYTVVKRPP